MEYVLTGVLAVWLVGDEVASSGLSKSQIRENGMWSLSKVVRARATTTGVRRHERKCGPLGVNPPLPVLNRGHPL